jgi:zinc transport system substrate-binding protein
MKKGFIAIFLSLILVVFVAGCGNNATGDDGKGKSTEKVQVYVSLFPLEDFAKKIGGDHVQVTNVIPTGVEPHDFELKAKDVAKLNDADLFVYASGFPSIEKVVKSLDQKKVTVINADTGIELMPEAEAEHEHSHDGEGAHENDHGGLDPHVWLDPQLAKKQAENIKNALVKVDKAHKADYEKNFADVADKLDKLDQDFHAVVDKAKQKKFVTSHAAFGYLAKRYGLQQIAVSGISPSDEPSPQELRELVEVVKENKVKVILFETLVSGKMADVVKREVKAEALTLNPLEGLTKEEVAQKADYFSIMEKNKENLAKALGVTP